MTARQAAFVLMVLAGCSRAQPALERLQDGDLVFHTSNSRQSIAVQAATGSKYSHCGIVFIREGKPFVFEAVQPVKFTPADAWRERGKGGKLVAYRLKRFDSGMSPQDRAALRKAAGRFAGLNYDLGFNWSDESIYCSELIWKVYKNALGIELCPLRTFRTFNLSDPTVKALIRERYGSRPPLDMNVVSPADLMASPALEAL
jgi:hypothetical protein